jgi:RNA polymerase sigma-70 factor, ECF subfamily
MGVTGSLAGPTADERHLVERARRGDRSAFHEIVTRHQQQVFRVALGLLRSEHDAEDVVQEVFMKAYRSLDSFRGEARLGTWLHRIAANTALRELRRRGARFAETIEPEPGEPLPVPDTRTDPERTLESHQLGAAIRRGVDGLSVAERTVFVLRHDAEMSLAEVARTLGLADGTVRNLFFRAVHKLRRELGPWLAAGAAQARP